MFEQKTLGFIGAGNMADALIRGIIKAGLTVADRILVSDIDKAKVQDMVSAYGVKSCKDNVNLVKQSDVVVLAVKPQNMTDVFEDIAAGVRPDQCFISIAAGVRLERLQAGLGPRARIVRVMPNTPALIGAGAAGIARGPHATEDDLALAMALFEAVGMAVVVDESQIDAVTAVSGSGPAYLFYFVEALLAGAERVGLDKEVAEALVKQTVLGAARMVDELKQTPGQLREAVTSPGGTTAAALSVLQNANFTDLIIRAIKAARDRSIELGRS